MQKKSTVTRVTSNGTWEGKFGLMYKFEIEMENGDIGENLSKASECKFKEGQETDYEFTDGDWPKIKPVNTFTPNSGGGGFKKSDNVQEYIIKQSSLKCAVDLCIAEGKFSHEEILNRANAFTDWVLDRNQPLPFSDEKAPF
tara:strand:+ start:781 stop:1206 length:426 start_codon:yes stop_codon:yes gene_type:complete